MFLPISPCSDDPMLLLTTLGLALMARPTQGLQVRPIPEAGGYPLVSGDVVDLERQHHLVVALRAVLASVEEESPDAVWCLGDTVG